MATGIDPKASALHSQQVSSFPIHVPGVPSCTSRQGLTPGSHWCCGPKAARNATELGG